MLAVHVQDRHAAIVSAFSAVMLLSQEKRKS